MLISFIFFIISGLGIFGMLFIHHRELATGESHLLTDLSEKGDTVIKEGVVSTVSLARKMRSKAGAFLAFHISKAVVVLESLVLGGIRWLNHRLEKVFQVIKGQVYPKSKGTVSFFLKHISEHKKNIQEERRPSASSGQDDEIPKI